MPPRPLSFHASSPVGWWMLAGIGGAFLVGSPSAAAPLSFAQALERAHGFAPELKARTLRTRAAQTAADAADALPDPQLDLSLQNVPVTGAEAFSLKRESMTMKAIGIRQDVPNLAKRRARLGRAEADFAAAQASEAETARSLSVAVALAWIDLYYAERRLGVLDLLDSGIDGLSRTVAARIASGSARPSQGLEPRRLRAELDVRRSVIEAEIAKAKAELARWTGDPSPRAVGPAPDWTLSPDRLLAAVNALPRLQVLDAATAQAEADARLARADKRPDWSVGVSYAKREPYFSDMVSLNVSIGLPLFSKHRQDPLIAARMEEAQAARLEREAAERAVRAELQAALAEHRAHFQNYTRATETLVPLAEKRAELEAASYAAGRIDLGAAIESVLALAEARVDAVEREATMVRDAIRIKLTYGEMPQ